MPKGMGYSYKGKGGQMGGSSKSPMGQTKMMQKSGTLMGGNSSVKKQGADGPKGSTGPIRHKNPYPHGMS